MTLVGKREVREAVISLKSFNVSRIISSDLRRASQTASIISKSLGILIEFDSELREINNGVLAGMRNEIANKEYPELYYSSLDFDQPYPLGESPEEFFFRVKTFFEKLSKIDEKCILLVTHQGVIDVINTRVSNTEYTNKRPSVRVMPAHYLILNI